ncbi:AAA family ATPase [Bacillus sp. FSL W7-1360]
MYNELAEEPLPAIYVAVDNYDLVKEEFEPLEARFVQLARDGQAHGVYLLITASQVTTVVKAALRNNMPMKVMHYMLDQADMQTVIPKTKFEVEPIPGRVLIGRKTTEFAQMYLPVAGETETELWSALKTKVTAINEQYEEEDRPEAMAMLPAELSLGDFHSKFAQLQEEQVPVGLDEITVKPVYVPFDTHANCVVVGRAGIGKTNVMQVILSSYAASNTIEEIVLCDSPTHTLLKLLKQKQANVRSIQTEEETLAWLDDLIEEFEARSEAYKKALEKGETLPTFKTTLLVIDDMDKMASNLTGDIDAKGMSRTAFKLVSVMREAAPLGLKILASGNSGDFMSPDQFTTELRKVRQGILLVKPSDQRVLKNLPKDPAGLKMGMGYYVSGSEMTKMKIPEVTAMVSVT